MFEYFHIKGLTMDVGQMTDLRSYIEHLSNNTWNAIRREVEGEEERLDHLSPALQTSLCFTPTVSKVYINVSYN